MISHGKFTYDKTADATYLSFREIGPGEAVEQVVVNRQDLGEVILDFSAAGEFLGVEVYFASRLLSAAVLAQATRIDRDRDG